MNATTDDHNQKSFAQGSWKKGQLLRHPRVTKNINLREEAKHKRNSRNNQNNDHLNQNNFKHQTKPKRVGPVQNLSVMLQTVQPTFRLDGWMDLFFGCGGRRRRYLLFGGSWIIVSAQLLAILKSLTHHIQEKTIFWLALF